jgi:hypothetical protein
MTEKKTRNYTGYKDLDNKLYILYDVQDLEEAIGRDTGETIARQNGLIAQGVVRDELKKKVITDGGET